MYRPLTVQPTQPAPETQISFGRAWMLWIGLTATWDTGAGITSNISDVSEAMSQIPNSPFAPASAARLSRRAGARHYPRSSLSSSMKSSEFGDTEKATATVLDIFIIRSGVLG